jgi:hypothetical protein
MGSLEIALAEAEARLPANPAPAKKALQTAVAFAQRQGARSFELRAALALAKPYLAGPPTPTPFLLRRWKAFR